MPINRSTHAYDGDLVVFLIGMRVNKPWHLRSWLQAFLAMPKMLKELSADPDSGRLGYRLTLEGRGATVIQYWNSVDKLYAYASNPTSEHRPAWTQFYRAAHRSPGAVGIWHETFQVSGAETFYADMGEFGLAKATRRVPINVSSQRARQRLDRARTS